MQRPASRLPFSPLPSVGHRPVIPRATPPGRRSGVAAHRSFAAGLGLALAVTLPSSAAGQPFVVRDADRIRAFPVAGVTLDMTPDEARAVLAAADFVEVSWIGRPAAPTGWNYEKGEVRVQLRQFAGVIRSIERIEQGRADSDVVDMEGPAEYIRTFFALADDECIEADEAVACTVRDTPRGDPQHVVTAQLLPYRTILRATRLPPPGR